jgi:hypothetical protein
MQERSGASRLRSLRSSLARSHSMIGGVTNPSAIVSPDHVAGMATRLRSVSPANKSGENCGGVLLHATGARRRRWSAACWRRRVRAVASTRVWPSHRRHARCPSVECRTGRGSQKQPGSRRVLMPPSYVSSEDRPTAWPIGQVLAGAARCTPGDQPPAMRSGWHRSRSRGWEFDWWPTPPRGGAAPARAPTPCSGCVVVCAAYLHSQEVP